MKKTLKSILAIVLVGAMMAGLCVTAMADNCADTGFNYQPGPNKPNDITITNGVVTVSLREKQNWPDDLDLVDSYAIAENVAYTLYVNGQNYQPIIDVNDVYHFIVFGSIVIAVPMIFAEGVRAGSGEVTLVAFGYPDGTEVDYQLLDPNGNPVAAGKAVIEGGVGRVPLPADLMNALQDGVYTFAVTAKDPDGNEKTFTSPLGVKGGQLASALDPAISNGLGKKKNGEIEWKDWPVGELGNGGNGGNGGGQKQSSGSGADHGVYWIDPIGKTGIGWNNDTRELTVNVAGNYLQIPTSKLEGKYAIGQDSTKGAPQLEVDFNGGSWNVPAIPAAQAVAGAVGLLNLLF